VGLKDNAVESRHHLPQPEDESRYAPTLPTPKDPVFVLRLPIITSASCCYYLSICLDNSKDM
jgi:hypothetical protein